MKTMLVIVAALALAMTACGSSDADTDGGGAAIPAGAGDGSSIAVSLGETGPDSMFMNLNAGSVTAGEVTFVVTNEGQKEHEFVVLKTETPAGEFPILPEDEAMAMGEEGEEGEHAHERDIDEDAPGIELLGEIGEIASGATESVTVTLEPGHYALVCNIRNHYSSGMWTDFTVA